MSYQCVSSTNKCLSTEPTVLNYNQLASKDQNDTISSSKLNLDNINSSKQNTDDMNLSKPNLENSNSSKQKTTDDINLSKPNLDNSNLYKQKNTDDINLSKPNLDNSNLSKQKNTDDINLSKPNLDNSNLSKQNTDEDYSSDSDDEASNFHMETFLRMTESLDNLKKMSQKDPSKAFDLSAIFPELADEVHDTVAPEHPLVDSLGISPSVVPGKIAIRTHASVMYFGDRLALSEETVVSQVAEEDYRLFESSVECFEKLVMGRFSDEEVCDLRRKHEKLLTGWNATHNEPDNEVGGDKQTINETNNEIGKLISCMIRSPVYFTSSCLALIGCGSALRETYRDSEGRQPDSFEDLMTFVRDKMRHNPVYPFECACETKCSLPHKRLLTLIMELPQLVYNQTYMLLMVAYMMWPKESREEVFVINLKNLCSPGTLDKIPVRVALLLGSVRQDVIKKRMASLRKSAPNFSLTNVGGGIDNRVRNARVRTPYSKVAMDQLVNLVLDPGMNELIRQLPSYDEFCVNLVLPKCENAENCLNKDVDARKIGRPEGNNDGKNKCCGFLRLDGGRLLASSVSMFQLCIYLYTDSRNAPQRVQQHYYVRDIMTCMAKTAMNIDDSCMTKIYGFLDRCEIFKGFSRNTIFAQTFQEVVESYISNMTQFAHSYKQQNRRKSERRSQRRVKVCM